MSVPSGHDSRSRGATARAALVCAACAYLFCAQTAQAQRLGRLFSTPDERFLLDELRREYEYGAPAEPEPEPDRPRAEAEKGPTFSQFTINGLVVRSAGPGSTWVNGSRVSQGDLTREGVRVDAVGGGSSVKIVLPSGADTIELKAGQKIDVASGAVLDAYEYRHGEAARNAFRPEAPESAMSEVIDKASDAAGKAVDTAKDVVEGAADRLKKLLQGE